MTITIADMSRQWARAILPILLSMLLPTPGVRAAAETVRVYPAPAGEPISSQFTVSVNRQNAPVYLAQVLAMGPEQRVKLNRNWNEYTVGGLAQTSFASFDLQHGATTAVTVTCSDAVTAARILPTSRGIVPKISGNRVTFMVSNPGQLVLEVNGDWVRSLQIFADPWDEAAPDPKDPNVIYFGPGIHQVSWIKATSGQTVYLAGGAFVYCIKQPAGSPKETPLISPNGKVFTGPGTPGTAVIELTGNNITLRGRGVIDGSLCPWHSRGLISATGRNIRIEGVVVRDPATNGIVIAGVDQLKVKNLKAFGYRGNSDGFNLLGVRDASVEGCYIRTGDDLVSVGARHFTGDTRNLTVSKCVLWNELAHALFMGSAIEEMCENVTFSDCDVIRDKGRDQVLAAVNADGGTARNTTFENIRIEECQWLIRISLEKGMFSHDPERGHFDGVTFRDIVSPPPERAPVPNHPNPDVDLKGYDAGHAIHGVTLDHVTIGGQALKADQVLQQNSFVTGVTVTP